MKNGNNAARTAEEDNLRSQRRSTATITKKASKEEFNFKDTSELKVPDRLIDQVIGQEHAISLIKQAARKRRNILLLGPPGVGKSMLGRAYAELLPTTPPSDVLAYPNPLEPNHPRIVLVNPGSGRKVIQELLREHEERHVTKWLKNHGVPVLIIGTILMSIIMLTSLDPFLILFGFLLLITYYSWKRDQAVEHVTHKQLPALLIDHENVTESSNGNKSLKPIFIEATASSEGSLFGDVLHDPYQSGGLETPPHLRLLPGAIHKANGGVLYIDEIATLRKEAQVELLTVLQDRWYPIKGRSTGSTAANVVSDPIPADFALVAAGNFDALPHLHPALRSRFQGYGYEILMATTMPDTPENRIKIAQFVAQEVTKEQLPHFSSEAVIELLKVARALSRDMNALTLELRRLGGIVRAAADLAAHDNSVLVEPVHVKQAVAMSSSIEAQLVPTLASSVDLVDLNVLSSTLTPNASVQGQAEAQKPASSWFASTIYCPSDQPLSKQLIKVDVLARPSPHKQKNGITINITALKPLSDETVRTLEITTAKAIDWYRRHGGSDADRKAVHDLVASCDLIIDYSGHAGGDVLKRYAENGDIAIDDATLLACVLSALFQIVLPRTLTVLGSFDLHGRLLPSKHLPRKIANAGLSGLQTVCLPSSEAHNDYIQQVFGAEHVEIIPIVDVEGLLQYILALERKD